MEPATVVAAVQATPVFCDRDATIEKVGELTKEAAGHGARLVAFSEGFVPDLPRLGVADDAVGRPASGTPAGSTRPSTCPARRATRSAPSPAEHECYLAIPVNERDGGTVYNTILYFGPDGALLGKHRKLVATGGERLVWGTGDGSTLAGDRHAVRPRRRADLLGELHAARARGDVRAGHRRARSRPRGTTPTCGRCRCSTSPRKAAATCSASRRASAAPTCPPTSPAATTSTATTTTGCRAATRSSSIRTGNVLAGPLTGETGHPLRRDRRATRRAQSRREFDVVGHYSRPDVFQLHVNRGDGLRRRGQPRLQARRSRRSGRDRRRSAARGSSSSSRRRT